MFDGMYKTLFILEQNLIRFTNSLLIFINRLINIYTIIVVKRNMILDI